MPVCVTHPYLRCIEQKNGIWSTVTTHSLVQDSQLVASFSRSVLHWPSGWTPHTHCQANRQLLVSHQRWNLCRQSLEEKRTLTYLTVTDSSRCVAHTGPLAHPPSLLMWRLTPVGLVLAKEPWPHFILYTFGTEGTDAAPANIEESDLEWRGLKTVFCCLICIL